MREWITAVGARTAFIEPGSAWENGTCNSFNSKLRDELLNGEIFYSLSLGYRPPAPAAVPWPAAPPQPASPATSTVAAKPTMH